MSVPVNYLLGPFEGSVDTGYPKGIKINFQATKEIDKDADKLDISVSNSKYIIYNFLSVANKYGWRSLFLMVDTSAGAKNIFWQVEQIHIADIRHQEHGYFGLMGI